MSKYKSFILFFIIIAFGQSIAKAQSPAKNIVFIGGATAFFVSGNELITAYHVIDSMNPNNIAINFNGYTYPARVVKVNQNMDAAKLEIIGYKDVCKQPLVISGKQLFQGTPYTMYGFPANEGAAFTSRSGRIVNPSYSMYSADGRRHWRRPAVHGDSGATGGYSGGPVLDNQTGECIGILTNGSFWGGAYFTSFSALGETDSWK